MFRADRDRHRFLRLLGDESERWSWRVLAWCLMTNHYHLLVSAPAGNLSQGMQRLNGRHAQEFNRRHGRRGHLWQDRFHGARVAGDGHLVEAARYVVLNPVRAQLCHLPEQWPWSSHLATLGLPSAGGPPVRLLELIDEDVEKARRRYAAFVADAGTDDRGARAHDRGARAHDRGSRAHDRGDRSPVRRRS